MIRIESLTEKTLQEAIDLVNVVFPKQEKEPARLEIPASLDPEKYQDFLLKNQMSDLRYWVAIEESSGKVVGTTGLYCYKTNKEEAFWLGWFCVDPTIRKRGIGVQLLQLSIKEARRQGKKFLRLYTSTEPNELASHRLYEEHGFRLIREEPLGGTKFKYLYYELEL